MNPKLLLPLLVLFTIACNPGTNPDGTEQSSNPDSAKTDSLNHAVPLSHIVYNCPVDKKATPYQATLKQSVSWEDSRGKNILIITERPQYFWKEENPAIGKYCDSPEDNEEVAEIFAWHYVYNETEKKWKALWTLNDFEFFCCDVNLQFLPGTIRITDLNKDGIGESIFTYISSAGTGPIDNFWSAKQMLHIDSVKYSIKGAMGAEPQYDEQEIETVYSSGFEKLDTLFSNYAKRNWERSDQILDSIFNVQQEKNR